MLASMLMSQLKNDYKVCTGADIKADIEFFERASEFFSPMKLYKDYFFSRSNSMWDRFMSQDMILALQQLQQ